MDTPPIPNAALEFLRAKKPQGSFSHLDVWGDEHAHTFVVAKITEADVAAAAQLALEKTLAAGGSFSTFKRNLKAQLEPLGWWGRRDVVDQLTGEIQEVDFSSPRRLRTVYDTNLRTAHAAGQWQRIQANKRLRPYLVYETGPSIEHRPEHLSWHGVCLPVDDPWWQTHFTPNGYGCKCRVRQISQLQYEQLQRDGISAPLDIAPVVGEPKPGASRPVLKGRRPTGDFERKRTPIQTEAPPSPEREWVNARTAEVKRVPVGVDPGFGFNPGAVTRLQQAAKLVADKLPALPPAIGAKLLESVAPVVAPQLADDFRDWARAVLADGRAKNTLRVAGALTPSLTAALVDRGVELASAAITVRDVELLHAARDAKKARTTASGAPKSLSDDDLLDLPRLLATAQAVVLDREREALLYIFPAKAREAGKIVVRVNFSLRAGGARQTVNSFRTATLIDLVDVRADLESGQLQLLEGGV